MHRRDRELVGRALPRATSRLQAHLGILEEVTQSFEDHRVSLLRDQFAGEHRDVRTQLHMPLCGGWSAVNA